MKKESLSVVNIPLEEIDYNPDNTSIFNMGDIERLAKRIEEEGYNDPILVYKKKNGRYEILSGHRRYEAMKFLNEKSIPSNVLSGKLTDTQKDLILLSSNIANRKLAPLDMARAIDFYKTILTRENHKGNKRKAIAEYFGITESNVHRYEVILKLIPELQSFCEKPTFPYSSLSKAASLTKEEQKQLYDELIRIEATTKNITEDEVEKDEIVFSRTRVELIINNKIRSSENAKNRDKTEDSSSSSKKTDADDKNKEIKLKDMLVPDDDDEIIDIESLMAPEHEEISNINLSGLDQCITTLTEYTKSSKTAADKSAIRDKLLELKRAIDKLEQSL